MHRRIRERPHQTAERFLREILGDDAVLVSEVEEFASLYGISERTLNRVRKRLGIVRENGTVFKKHYGGPWFMRLPMQSATLVANDSRKVALYGET